MNAADRVIRWAAALCVLVVATIAATISYGHARARRGQRRDRRCRVRPAGHGRWADHDVRSRPAGCRSPRRKSACHGVVVAGRRDCGDARRERRTGASHGPVGIVVSAWPAVVATGSLEMFLRLLRGGQEPQEDSPGGSESDPLDPDLVPMVATAREHFREVLATGALPSVRAIRRGLRVGHPRATAIKAALAK